MDGGRVEDAPLLQNKETPTEPATQSNEYPYIPDGGYKNDVIKKAWDISNKDKRFVLMLSTENGAFNTTTKSKIGYKRRGGIHYDYGLCQLSSYYHPKYFDKDGKHWLDMTVDEQLEVCYKLYKGGTKFYGLDKGNPLKIIFPNNQ